MKAFVKNGYNQIAEAYLQERGQFKNHTYLHQFTKVVPKGSTVLDIGCGAGVPIDEFLTKQGYLVWGIDLSEKQIELARKLVPRAAFEVKDMTQLKFGEYAVDAVVSFYAIFHIPREQHLEMLKKIRSFLQPGGWLLITMGSEEWVGTENFHGTDMKWSNYDAEKNKKLVAEAGFELSIAEIDHAGGEKHLVVLAQAI